MTTEGTERGRRSEERELGSEDGSGGAQECARGGEEHSIESSGIGSSSAR